MFYVIFQAPVGKVELPCVDDEVTVGSIKTDANSHRKSSYLMKYKQLFLVYSRCGVARVLFNGTNSFTMATPLLEIRL